MNVISLEIRNVLRHGIWYGLRRELWGELRHELGYELSAQHQKGLVRWVNENN